MRRSAPAFGGRLVPLLAASATVAVTLWLHPSTGRDDAHISYWPAATLAADGAVVNYNGEAVEQSSSLLQVVLLAAAHRLTGAALPTLGVLLSLAAAALTVVAAWTLARRLGAEAPGRAAAVVAVLPYATYWAASGMDASLAALCATALVAATVALADGRGRSPSALLAPAAWAAAHVLARPEGVLTLVAAAAALVGLTALGGGWRRGASGHAQLRATLAVAGLGTAAFALAATWRWAAFGRVFPQPVYAKAASPSWARCGEGLDYLVAAGLAAPSLLLIAVAAAGVAVAAVARPGARPGVLVALAFALAHLAFVVTAGGDWMEGGRFLVPVLPLLTVVAVAALERLARPLARVLAAALVVVALTDTVRFARSGSTGVACREVATLTLPVLARHPGAGARFSWFELAGRVHLRDVPFILELEEVVSTLLAAGHQPVTLMSSQMGMVPFHLAGRFPGRVRFSDMRGLVTRDLVDCPAAADVGTAATGLALDFPAYFARAGAIETGCGVAPPDLIFTLANQDILAAITAHGYDLVVLLSGEVPGGAARRQVSASQALLVRRELAPLVVGAGPRLASWPGQVAAATISR